MRMLPIVFLFVLGFIVTSCVTSTVNSDGTVQKNTIDKVKLADTYIDLAVEYQQHGAPQVALDRVNLAIKSNPDSAKAYMIRAMIYQSLGQLKDAEKDFKKSINIDDNYSEAYVNYAVFLCEQKRFDDALNNFNTALANPLYYTPEIAYYSRGICYYRNSMLESANADYLRSLSYRSPPQDVYIALAKLQLDKKNYQLANYYINKFNGSQTPDTMWLHVQILQYLIDGTNNARERKEYTSYRDTIGKLLVTNYGDSTATQQYLLKYGSGSKSGLLAKSSNIKSESSKVVITKDSTDTTKDVSVNSISRSTSNQKYIVVEQGDTLYSISRKTGVSISEIKKINNLNGDKVEIGSKIYLN